MNVIVTEVANGTQSIMPIGMLLASLDRSVEPDIEPDDLTFTIACGDEPVVQLKSGQMVRVTNPGGDANLVPTAGTQHRMLLDVTIMLPFKASVIVPANSKVEADRLAQGIIEGRLPAPAGFELTFAECDAGLLNHRFRTEVEGRAFGQVGATVRVESVSPLYEG